MRYWLRTSSAARAATKYRFRLIEFDSGTGGVLTSAGSGGAELAAAAAVPH